MMSRGFRERRAQTPQIEHEPLPPCPFQVEVLDSGPAVLTDRTLACIHYGLAPGLSSDPRIIHVPLCVLDGPGHAEIWSGSAPVRTSISDGIRHCENGSVLFGSLHIGEQANVSIERATVHAYVRIHQLLERLGFPHWLRVWNYLGDINGGEGDAERYRQFSAGRHHALALKPDFERHLPAATAVGTHAAGLTIAFLAARHPSVQIENPRQMSAFRYPRDYGPKSPSFSRASLQRWREHAVLFLSGTASIVGHATLSAGDPAGQLSQTLTNIDALLANAAQLHFPGQPQRFQPDSFKLYVRSADVFAQIAPRLQQTLGRAAPLTVLESELCRRDLLLEVEAVYRWPNTAGLSNV